jgi:hypothetical protein
MATKRARTPLLVGSGPLARVSPAAVFVGVLAVFAAGVLIGGLAGAVLLGLGVLALLAATWSVLSRPGRALRLVALAALVAVVVVIVLR